MLKNDHFDREKIRRETFYKPAVQSVISGPFSQPTTPEMTPVLLTYWTQENLETYLIPATPKELDILKKVNGIDHQGSHWQSVERELDYIQRMRYCPDSSEYGPWKEKYFIDTHDEEGNPLPPVALPPNTILVQTGFIL